ncbi:MAG: HAMP domain-containing histidine kinase [Oscillospiraceae bacterium]|nr:HAMP domain-containing histidine kinase [Oscillospiraceae bacterium]
MIKILCSPLTKLLLVFAAYLALVSALRGVSHTFHVLFRSIFGDWLHFGLIPSFTLLAMLLGALGFSVFKTKKGFLRQETLFVLWRKIDGFLMIVFAIWFALFLMIQTYRQWGTPESIIPYTGAYLLFILVATEIIARIRDKEFMSSFCLADFFKKYPVWSPLGLLILVTLMANLLILFFSHLSSIGVGVFLRASAVIMVERAVVLHFNAEGFLQTISALSIVGIACFVMVLRSLSKKYDKANDEKLRSERFKSELITNVSHDIRTPLTSIINYVDLLKARPLNGDTAEYVAVLDRKSARLKTLIDDLMDASKAGTGNVKVEPKSVDLTELIGQVAGEFDDLFIARNLTLALRQPDETVFAIADSRHLWRTLENLFSNAIKYSLPGTRVFAELSQIAEKTVFTMKNTSQTPIDLSGDALTEQFIRGDKARESEGSGLGLYIAKSLVELMDGQFEIRTSGDLFEVEIRLSALPLPSQHIHHKS